MGQPDFEDDGMQIEQMPQPIENTMQEEQPTEEQQFVGQQPME